MDLVSTFFQMFVVLGMYNFEGHPTYVFAYFSSLRILKLRKIVLQRLFTYSRYKIYIHSFSNKHYEYENKFTKTSRTTNILHIFTKF